MKTRRLLFVMSSIVATGLFLIGLFIFAKAYSTPPRARLNIQNKTGTIVKNNNEQTQPEDSSLSMNLPVNILLMGVDEYGVRSDVMVLMNFSPDKHSINMLSIPRDTKVRYKGKTLKINALAATGGMLATCQKVTQITDLPVHFYATINFKGFRRMIDILGGVNFNVPINMRYDDPDQGLHINIHKGWQTLNGSKSEQFVRYRKGNRTGQGYSDGDIGRIKAQQDFVKVLLQQKLRWRYINKIDDIFKVLQKYMETNVDINDITYYIPYLTKVTGEDIKGYTVIGDAEYTNKTWYFDIDIEKTQYIINSKFFK